MIDECPIILERTCCEPVKTIKLLKNARVHDRIEKYKEINNLRIGKKEEVIYYLEGCIAEHLEAGSLYYDLLKLKRNIFNERHDKISPNLLNSVKDFVGQVVLEYIDLFQKEFSLMQDIKKIIEDKELESRAVLKNSFDSNKDLYNGIMHISPTIYHQLDKYISKPLGKEKSKEKKVEDVLIKLITKACLKPSPLSTFVKNRVVKSDLKEIQIEKENIKDNKLVKAYINNVHIMRIFESICNYKEVQLISKYMLNGLIMKNSRGDYGFVKFEDRPKDKPKVFKTENVFKVVKNSKKLENLIKCLRENADAVTFNRLCEICNIEDKEKGYLYLKELLNSGVIYHTEKLGNNTKDIILEYFKKVEEMNILHIEFVQSISVKLEIIEKLLTDFNSSNNVKDKVNLYKKIRIELQNIYLFCELDVEDLKRGALLYEECFESSQKEMDLKLDEETKQVIETIMHINSIFDCNTYIQTFFGDEFIKEYGKNGSTKMENSKIWSMLVKSNSEFQYLWQNGWKIKENTNYSRTIKELMKLKEQFIEYIKENDNKEEIKLNNLDIIKKFVDKLPEPIKRRLKSYTFFLQGTKDNIVVNDMYSGFLINYERFFDYIEDEALQNYIYRIFFGDIKISEIYENYGFNANSHRPIGPYKLVTKNSINRNQLNGFKGKIVFEESEFVYNDMEKRVDLLDESIGVFRPIFLSSMAIYYLPGVFPALHNNTVNVMGIPDFHDLVLENSEADVQVLPRVKIDKVVLARKAWKVQVNALPNKENYSDRIDLCISLLNWLSDNKIDYEVFVKGGIAKEGTDQLIKPQYIDFSNILFVEVLYKLIDGYKTIIFEEVNPSIDLMKNEYVKEYLYEISFK